MVVLRGVEMLSFDGIEQVRMPTRLTKETRTRWQESKFAMRRGVLSSSWNTAEVSPGSRFLCDGLGAYLERVLKEHAKGELLDAGCGKAPLFGVYEHLVSGYVWMDFSDRNEEGTIDVVADLNGPIPLQSAQFDTVLLTDVLEHLHQPQNALSELHRVLTEGGTLIATVPFLYGLHEEPNDYHRFTEHALRSKLALAGFKSSEIHVIMGGLDAWISLSLKLLQGMPFIGTPLVRLFYHLSPVRKWIPGYRWFQRKYSRIFPLEYGIIAVK